MAVLGRPGWINLGHAAGQARDYPVPSMERHAMPYWMRPGRAAYVILMPSAQVAGDVGLRQAQTAKGYID